MPKNFSQKDKEKALKLLASGQAMSQVAEQIGCSTFSLQAWKKQAKAQVNDQTECKAPECCLDNDCSSPPAPKKGSADDFVRKFWNKNYRAVDMLLDPKDVSSDEAVKLVNEALVFAYENLQK